MFKYEIKVEIVHDQEITEEELEEIISDIDFATKDSMEENLDTKHYRNVSLASNIELSESEFDAWIQGTTDHEEI